MFMRMFSARLVCALACLAVGATAVDAKGRRKVSPSPRHSITKPKSETPAAAAEAGRALQRASRPHEAVGVARETVAQTEPEVPGDSSQVKALLAANPNSALIICLAGCGPAGVPKVIYERSREQPVVAGAASMTAPPAQDGRTRSGVHGTAGSADGAATQDGAADAEVNEIVCLAGCNGPVGVVVFRGQRFAWISNDKKHAVLQSFAELAKSAATASAATAPTEPASQRTWVTASARAGLAHGLADHVQRARAIYMALQERRPSHAG